MKKQIARAVKNRMKESKLTMYRVMTDAGISNTQLDAILQREAMKGAGYTYDTLHKVCKAIGTEELILDLNGNQVTLKFKQCGHLKK